MFSEVEPESSVGNNASEGQTSPHHFVSSMSVGRDREFLEVTSRGDSGEHLAAIRVEVNHVKHHLLGLFTVGCLHDQSQLLGLHIGVVVKRGAVGLRVLGPGITLVENSLNSAHRLRVEMHALVLEIVGDPASVNEDSLLFARRIQVCVEGSDNVDTLLAVLHLLNLNFTSVIEDATDLHGLHRPVAHELVKLVGLRPRELTLVSRSDVDGLLAHEVLATANLVLLLLATTVLVLCSLVHEHYQKRKG